MKERSRATTANVNRGRRCVQRETWRFAMLDSEHTSVPPVHAVSPVRVVHIPPRPLATSGRFCRRIRPERLHNSSISPGQRSRHHTAPAKNSPEVQTHGKIGAHFLRNHPEVAGCGRGRSRGGHQRASTNAIRSPASKAARQTHTPPPSSQARPYPAVALTSLLRSPSIRGGT